jgi:hypothetical protein
VCLLCPTQIFDIDIDKLDTRTLRLIEVHVFHASQSGAGNAAYDSDLTETKKKSRANDVGDFLCEECGSRFTTKGGLVRFTICCCFLFFFSKRTEIAIGECDELTAVEVHNQPTITQFYFLRLQTFHKRKNCDGGVWRCDWCGVDKKTGGGRCPGPKGPSTLCSACGSRYRAGNAPLDFFFKKQIHSRTPIDTGSLLHCRSYECSREE